MQAIPQTPQRSERTNIEFSWQFFSFGFPFRVQQWPVTYIHSEFLTSLGQWRMLQLAGVRPCKDQTPQAKACATYGCGTTFNRFSAILPLLTTITTSPMCRI